MLDVVLERCRVLLARQQQVADVLSRMDAAFEPAVHATPELDHLRTQIRSNDVVAGLARPVKGVDVLVHVVGHVTPQREGLFGKF